MIGKEKLLKRLESALAKSKADHTEIVCVATDSGLTRYANSHIHQNVFESNCRVFCRAVTGNRIGIASTNSLVLGDLRKTLENSLDIARKQPENPDFPGLAPAGTVKDIDTCDSRTASCRPAERAKIVKTIVREADRHGFTVAGALATSGTELAVVNSNDLRRYQPLSASSVNMIIMSDTSSGYAAESSRAMDDIDFSALAVRASQKCKQSQNPKAVEPGDYEVILEPAAVALMLEWLNYVGFGSKPFLQNMSFLSGNAGKKITSEDISVYDNGLDTKGMPLPFDFEGMPKKKVFLINKGCGAGPVLDLASARKAKRKSTGHAISPDMRDRGAFAQNIFMSPGKAKRADMIAGVKRGILVTRFHYLNGMIDPRNSVLTG